VKISTQQNRPSQGPYTAKPSCTAVNGIQSSTTDVASCEAIPADRRAKLVEMMCSKYGGDQEQDLAQSSVHDEEVSASDQQATVENPESSESGIYLPTALPNETSSISRLQRKNYS
jgi:hypothetical protein